VRQRTIGQPRQAEAPSHPRDRELRKRHGGAAGSASDAREGQGLRTGDVEDPSRTSGDRERDGPHEVVLVQKLKERVEAFRDRSGPGCSRGAAPSS
jgi:hypothetical protein